MGRMSSLTIFPLLALLVVANTAVGFIAPSLHVGTAVQRQSIPTASRCRLASTKAGLRRRGDRKSAGLSMEVEPHVLRLQAAELGSRLRVSNPLALAVVRSGVTCCRGTQTSSSLAPQCGLTLTRNPTERSGENPWAAE